MAPKLFLRACNEQQCHRFGQIPTHGVLFLNGQTVAIVFGKTEAQEAIRELKLPLSEEVVAFERLDCLGLSEEFSMKEHLLKNGGSLEEYESAQMHRRVMVVAHNELARAARREPQLAIASSKDRIIPVYSTSFGEVAYFHDVVAGVAHLAELVKTGRISEAEAARVGQRLVLLDLGSSRRQREPAFELFSGTFYGIPGTFGVLLTKEDSKVFWSKRAALEAAQFAGLSGLVPLIESSPLPYWMEVVKRSHYLSGGFVGMVYYVSGLELGRDFAALPVL